MRGPEKAGACGAGSNGRQLGNLQRSSIGLNSLSTPSPEIDVAGGVEGVDSGLSLRGNIVETAPGLFLRRLPILSFRLLNILVAVDISSL